MAKRRPAASSLLLLDSGKVFGCGLLSCGQGVYRDSCLPRFQAEQFALALCAPAVSFRAAVLVDHTMAGHQHCQTIRRAGSGHGAYRRLLPDRTGHFGVSPGLAGRNFLKLLPYLLLESSPANVERYAVGGLLACN